MFEWVYCMSKKYSPILYSNLLYNLGKDFLDRQYVIQKKTRTRRTWLSKVYLKFKRKRKIKKRKKYSYRRSTVHGRYSLAAC